MGHGTDQSLAENLLERFLTPGADPNLPGEGGSGPLHRLAHTNTSEILACELALADLLLDRGAQVDHPGGADFTPLEVQKDYFDRHMRLAQDHGLPIIIHCREAEEDVLSMLRRAVDRAPISGVLHAFSGDPAFAAECLELGLHVSLAGPVTYINKKFETLRAAAQSIPDDRLLIETDSPYLMPHPLRGKQKRNEPANLIHTARRLAELRNCPLDELAALTGANARRLFGLE